MLSICQFILDRLGHKLSRQLPTKAEPLPTKAGLTIEVNQGHTHFGKSLTANPPGAGAARYTSW